MYVKHGTLIDADASAAKTSIKHLESRLEVIQGNAYLNHKKPTRDCVLLYKNVAFRVGNFEGKV